MPKKSNSKKTTRSKKQPGLKGFINKYSRPILVVLAVALVGTFMIVRSLADASPSGQAMPVGDLDGWKQIFAEDFTVNAPLGSMGSDSDAGKVVYTGAGGTKWVTYPKTYLDTYQKRPYRSDQVLSVHDGVLDFWLHNVDGQPAGANPSPIIDGTKSAPDGQYQVYGRYSARIRLDSNSLSEYYAAWLLWPQNEANWQCAETDFPEAGLSSTSISAFAHYGCNGAQDYFGAGIDLTQWHTFTQEWLPGKRNFYIDNTLIGTATNQVYSQPERWQLQTETNGNGTHSGHLYVDWAVVYQYSPTTKASASTATTTPTVPATTTTTPTPATPVAPATDNTAPSAPTNVKASNIKTTSVDISWTASTDNIGVTGYDIYRNGVYLASSQSTSYTMSGLTCGTSYDTRIVALDAARNWVNSDTVAFKTADCSVAAPAPTPTPPTTPPTSTPTTTNPSPTTKPEPAPTSSTGSGTVTPVTTTLADSGQTPPPQIVTGTVSLPTVPTTPTTTVTVDGHKTNPKHYEINTRRLDNGDHTITVTIKKNGTTQTSKAIIRVQNKLSWWEKIRNFFF